MLSYMKIQVAISIPMLMSTFVFLTNPVSAQDRMWEPGDRVVAEWSGRAWYLGTIDSECEGGYLVIYDDGDTKCAEPHELTPDEMLQSGDIEVGTLMLASWASAFYPAKITSIRDSGYGIVFYDGYVDNRELEQLRVLSGSVAKRNDFVMDSTGVASDSSSDEGQTTSSSGGDLLLAQDIEIWRGGSLWATIESNGKIWIGGSNVGEFESDGEVWVGSSSAGEIESDGDIWFGSSDVGDIEENGRLWLGGSRIAEIDSGGDIYLEGSWWGEVDPFEGSKAELRAVAAVLAFFAAEFGFYE